MIEKVKALLEIRFIRFLIVGGINTLFGYGVFAILILFGLHYVLASALSTIAGVLFNFQTIRKLVFQSHDNGLIFRFILLYCFLYLVQLGLLRGFELIEVKPIIAGMIFLAPMALLSYILNKKFVFHNKVSTMDVAKETIEDATKIP
ncbi:MAG: GtrA family protein [SAR324 cluster bacterium]|nr:GtrA family protein [SAR324 cluster bacterium]